VILPLGIINILVAIFALKNFGEQTYPKFNFLGIVLSTIGLGTLLLGFSNAGDKPWFTFNVAGFVLIGLVVTGLFIYQQTHTKLPMLNFSVFKHRIFTLSSITNFVVIMGLYGGMILLPLYIQNVRGVSPMTSGMVLLPGAIIMAIMSPITGALYDRIGARYLSFTGLIILSIGTFMFTLIDMNTTVTYLAIMQGARSFGLGLALMPIQTDALNDLPLELMSHGSAMYNTIRQIAGSLGTALLVTIMSISTSNFAAENVGISIEEATLHGIQIAYIVVTAISVVAAVMCLKLSKKAK
jgi:EmrB/QacA subfamily drug resistance transporter